MCLKGSLRAVHLQPSSSVFIQNCSPLAWVLFSCVRSNRRAPTEDRKTPPTGRRTCLAFWRVSKHLPLWGSRVWPLGNKFWSELKETRGPIRTLQRQKQMDLKLVLISLDSSNIVFFPHSALKPCFNSMVYSATFQPELNYLPLKTELYIFLSCQSPLCWYRND